jgi:hypothetical protein
MLTNLHPWGAAAVAAAAALRGLAMNTMAQLCDVLHTSPHTVASATAAEAAASDAAAETAAVSCVAAA